MNEWMVMLISPNTPIKNKNKKLLLEMCEIWEKLDNKLFTKNARLLPLHMVSCYLGR